MRFAAAISNKATLYKSVLPIWAWFMANRSRTFVASASPSLPLVAGATAVPALRASAAATFEQRALELVNGAGAARGIGPVQVSTALAGIAGDAPYDGCGDRVLGRSTDMGARNYFSHTIRDCANKGVSAILQAAGVTYGAMAENIGWASALTDPLVAAERLNNDLMASPVHRDNILNPAFTHVGLGSGGPRTAPRGPAGGRPCPTCS